MKEEGLSDCLVLLSVYETCRCRRVSFLKFFLSEQQDVESFCRGEQKKKRTPRLEVYPTGFSRSGRKTKTTRRSNSQTP
jgi:hypothetical protein